MDESSNFFSEQSIASILDNMQDVYFRTDRSGRFIYVSKAIESLIGVPPDELVGKLMSDYCASDMCNCSLRLALEDGHGVVSDLRFSMHHMNGKLKWVSVNAHNFEQQGYRGVEGSLRDITEQKKAEDKNALLQRQLRQAQKMEAIGQLTGGLAHDFNNILTSILGYAGLGQLQYSEEDRVRLLIYFQQIAKAGERARDLISNMLTYSRGTSTKQNTIHPEYLLNELQPMLRAVLPTSINLSICLDENLPSCEANIGQLQQVIMNLCINAKDAMNDVGNIDIHVAKQDISELECASCHKMIDGPYIVCTVSDNGSGISDAVRGFVFDPFFSTKETGKGSGMGLSITHGIIHEHRGHIALNTGSRGTEVSFLLPIVDERIERNVEEPGLTVEQTADTSPATILVVDDEQAIAGLLENLFKRVGYDVIVMTSSVEAKQFIENDLDKIDLLVSDQTMPSVSGLDLAASAHRLDAKFPVIICSGYSKHINASNYRDFGVSRFFEKPIDLSKLVHAVGEALRQREVAIAS